MAKHAFTIEAAVILPDHLHMVWTLPEGDADFSMRWRLIKSRFSKSVETESPLRPSQVAKHERGIWQRRFYEHMIRDETDLNQHIEYIHFNPVKHGYVARPIDWPYSSIHRYVKAGVLDAAWGTNEVVPDLQLD